MQKCPSTKFWLSPASEAKEFPRSGINLDLTGKHDEMLDEKLKPFWHDAKTCGGMTMPQWREAYMKDVQLTGEAKEFKSGGNDHKAAIWIALTSCF